MLRFRHRSFAFAFAFSPSPAAPPRRKTGRPGFFDNIREILSTNKIQVLS